MFLQRNIDYVCGLGLEGVDRFKMSFASSPTLFELAHVAFAKNAYYQSTDGKEYDCDFELIGAITNVDPSK